MREHADQIAGARQTLEANYTDTQRKLAEDERARGNLLGTVVGLTVDDLDRCARRWIMDHMGNAGPHPVGRDLIHGTHSGRLAGTRSELNDQVLSGRNTTSGGESEKLDTNPKAFHSQCQQTSQFLARVTRCRFRGLAPLSLRGQIAIK